MTMKQQYTDNDIITTFQIAFQMGVDYQTKYKINADNVKELSERAAMLHLEYNAQWRDGLLTNESIQNLPE